jgi:hypothetical protein
LETVDGLDADDLDDGYKDAEGEEAEEDDLFLVWDLGRDEDREGEDHAVLCRLVLRDGMWDGRGERGDWRGRRETYMKMSNMMVREAMLV